MPHARVAADERSVGRTLPPKSLLLALGLAFLTLALALPAGALATIPAVQVHLAWGGVDEAEMDRQLDRARAANARMIRLDIGWSSIEQDAKGRYEGWYLAKLDTIVEKARGRGLQVLGTFTTSPCWASSAPADVKQGCDGAWWDRNVQNYPPSNPANYADALAFVVRRYGDRVAAWEVWNEPNLDHFFKSADRVGDYAALVRAAYPAAKAADPRPAIIAGSLSESDFEFTSGLYDHGIKGHFDAFSVHPYSGARSPLTQIEQRYAMSSFIQGVPAVRDVMLGRGDDKPIWLTEFGWSTTTAPNTEGWHQGVDPASQGVFIKQAFEQMRQWSYVPVGVYYEMKDMGTDRSELLDNFGLLRSDGAEKPAYSAFREAAAALASGAQITELRPGASASSRRGRQARLLLRVSRRGGRVSLRGRAPRGSVVTVRAYRYLSGRSRFSGQAGYRVSMRADSNGRFARRLRTRRLSRGSWRLMAVTRGPSPRLRASSRLR